MPPPRDIPPAVLAEARAGRLTDRNTARGSIERSAVYRVESERRKALAWTRAGAGPAPTAREALGHRRPGDDRRTISAYLADPARLVDVEVSLGVARRIGRHNELVRLMASGANYRGRLLTPARFERLVKSWRPVKILDPAEERGERRLLADAGAVIALLELARAEERAPFRYERRGRGR